MLRSIGLDRVPAYLQSVTILEPEVNVRGTVADAVHRLALARRKALLVKFATGLAGAVVVGLGAYSWWAHRAPAQETVSKDGAPTMLVAAGASTMGDDEESPRREIYLD